MEDSLLSFCDQFSYEPEIINGAHLPSFNRYVVCGMGGSHLHADLLKGYDPTIDLVVHSDYGLAPEAHVPPSNESARDDTLFIAQSYSGNTEEVIDFARRAYDQEYHVACITTGGALGDMAREKELPLIELPQAHIQPRVAIGHALLALLSFIRPDVREEVKNISQHIVPADLREEGEEIARALTQSIPLIYSSTPNRALAYTWKIAFNETGKIPAFFNVVPELNHNEMQGFDRRESTQNLSEAMRFVFIRDENDHPQVQKLMEILEKQYEEKGLEVIRIYLTGATYFERTFRSIIVGMWAACACARIYGVEPEEVPLIEAFKKHIT